MITANASTTASEASTTGCKSRRPPGPPKLARSANGGVARAR